MAVRFDEILVTLDIGASELSAWIEQHWVLPVEVEGDLLFDDPDVARVKLIAELRNDLGVNADAIPGVLRLRDHVPCLRLDLARACGRERSVQHVWSPVAALQCKQQQAS